MAKFKLQVNESKDFTGLITKDSLTAMGQSNPSMVSKTTTMLYKANHLVGTSDYLESIGNVVEVERNEDGWVYWKLQGSGTKLCPLSRATDISGNEFTAASKAGIGKSAFYMYFTDKIFTDVHLIVGEKGSKYQLLIQDDPIEYGTEYRYTVKLAGGSLNHYMPYEELVAGKMFSIDAAPVESTMSKKGAGFSYTSPIEMRNTFSMQRFQEIVPGNMEKRALVWTITTDDGQKKTFWDDYASWVRKKQIKHLYEKMIYWGTLNTDDNGNVLDTGKSGNPLRMGAGIYQQMEQGNKFFMSIPNLDFIEEIVLDLSDNTKDLAERNDIIIQTGKWGSMELRRQIKNKATSFTPLQSDMFLSRGKDGGLGLDTNFSQYTFSNGSKLTIMVNNMFDDVNDARNTILMSRLVPGLPGPANSYQYHIMDVGNKNKGMNLQLRKVKGIAGEYHFGIKPGLRTPLGAMLAKEGSVMAHATDATEYHYMTPEVCVVLVDPSRTVIIKPSILE